VFKDGEIVDMARLTQAVADLERRLEEFRSAALEGVAKAAEREQLFYEAETERRIGRDRRGQALGMAIDAARAMTHRDVTPGTVLEFAAIFESFLRGDMTETSHDPETGRAEVGDLEGNAG
jgi:hypothetical protein